MTEVQDNAAITVVGPAPLRHALVASRICHDLVGPLGAIANGLELMGLSGDSSPEGDLIAASVADAIARVRFFRIAYGVTLPDQTVSRAEIVGTLLAVSRGGRMSYDWQAPGDGPRDVVRAVFLILQCMESSMPLGGHVRVARVGDAWEVTGEGHGLKLDENLWHSVLAPQDHAPPDSPALIHFALLPEMLATLHRTLALKHDGNRLVARI